MSGNPRAAEASPRLQETLSAFEAELDRGSVPLWIFNDPEVHRLELERLFPRTWIFLAHESEIPMAGDYVTRNIGEDSFLVVRGADAAVRVMFNACRHRGTKLCITDRGNTHEFICPYHGWLYDSSGKLASVPNQRDAFKGLDAGQWGLIPAPRVESYRGLVFACLDESVGSLAEHLGDFRWYLDLHLTLTPGGMEVIGEPIRWMIEADWKNAADNFSGDSYHTQTVHRFALKFGLVPRATAGSGGNPYDVHVTECSGHTTSIRQLPPDRPIFWGYPDEIKALFANSTLSPEQVSVAKGSLVHSGNIFPNLSFLHVGGTNDPKKPMIPYLTLRQWQPRGPGRMEVVSWVLAPSEASDAYKKRSYSVASSQFGSAGTFEQDDASAWSGIARTAKGVFPRRIGMKLNYEMGLPWMSEARIKQDWPGPGIVYDSNLEEGVQRTFLRQWARLMAKP